MEENYTKEINFGELFEEPLSVSDYIDFLNRGLQRFNAKIIGEVSEIKIASSGHVYFSLRDKNKNAIIKCVIWKSQYRLYGVNLKDGLEIIVNGTPAIYPSWGSLSLKIESIELVGEGNLKKAYEELKKKLQKEGIFDESRKREIPEFPQKIGIITSTHGAVIHDFINNLGKFGFKIKIKNSKVEGQEALVELISSIRFFKDYDIDLLVIIRGGGSFQSLAAFDNETLVREIVNFPVPVIAGIGHHQDITLSSLAADAAESTPTAVANLLNRSWERALNTLQNSTLKIIQGMDKQLLTTHKNIDSKLYGIIRGYTKTVAKYQEIENLVLINFSKIEHSFIKLKDIFDKSIFNIFSKFQYTLEGINKKIDFQEQQVKSNNPKRQLKLGYSILRKSNTIIKSINGVKIGDSFSAELSDGEIHASVNKIKKNYG